MVQERHRRTGDFRAGDLQAAADAPAADVPTAHVPTADVPTADAGALLRAHLQAPVRDRRGDGAVVVRAEDPRSVRGETPERLGVRMAVRVPGTHRHDRDPRRQRGEERVR